MSKIDPYEKAANDYKELVATDASVESAPLVQLRELMQKYATRVWREEYSFTPYQMERLLAALSSSLEAK